MNETSTDLITETILELTQSLRRNWEQHKGTNDYLQKNNTLNLNLLTRLTEVESQLSNCREKLKLASTWLELVTDKYASLTKELSQARSDYCELNKRLTDLEKEMSE